LPSEVPTLRVVVAGLCKATSPDFDRSLPIFIVFLKIVFRNKAL
jgi:hypothetical protein